MNHRSSQQTSNYDWDKVIKRLKNTVEIDWQNRTFSYQLNEDELGQVHFLELHQSHTDWFRYCCSIAIAQDYHTTDEGVTAWTGASDDFISKVLKRFGWHSKTSTRNIYWTHFFSKGSKAKFPCFTETNSIDPDGKETWAAATTLFKMIDGYVLGKPTKLDTATYKLWSIKFINQDEDFTKFQQQVLQLVDVGVPTQQDVSPKKKFKYLQEIIHVLRINTPDNPKRSPDKSEWFRKTGPIAIDFLHKKVFRREKKLKELKSLVLNNSFSILEGIAATGKTVLVRNLAWDLHKKERVYYFEYREFDVDILATEINAVQGIVIIEDIHLEPQSFQLLYSLYDNEHSHILLTTRPSFREKLHSRKVNLSELPTISLEPFDNVDEIIGYYSRRHQRLPWSDEDRYAIKSVSSESFWLLAYALEGYMKKEAKGNSKDWLEVGVKDDLRDLENSCISSPQVLVALSPLYLHEVLTAEDYLLDKLGFDYEVLKQLVQIGEITHQKTDGGIVYYGLPHSALADAYWEHGQEYRRHASIPEYEDFIYDYAASGTPNGLKAVVRNEDDIAERVVRRLSTDGSLGNVIRCERSMEVIAWFAHAAPRNYLLEESVLQAIASRINEHEDIKDIFACIKQTTGRHRSIPIKERFLPLLDRAWIADRMMEATDLLNWAAGLFRLTDVSEEFTSELCGRLRLDELADKLDRENNLSAIDSFLWMIREADTQASKEILQRLNLKKLAAKLNQSKDLNTTKWFIERIKALDADVLKKLRRMLD